MALKEEIFVNFQNAFNNGSQIFNYVDIFQKPLSFIMAIRDTYGYQCNQTIFYTTSEEIYKKVGGNVISAKRYY